jgi:hypothetical protein
MRRRPTSKRRERAKRKAKGRLVDTQSHNPTFSNSSNYTSTITTWWARITRVFTKNIKHVAEIQSNGVHPQFDLSMRKGLAAKAICQCRLLCDS